MATQVEESKVQNKIKYPGQTILVARLFRVACFSSFGSELNRLSGLGILPCMKQSLFNPYLPTLMLKTGLRLAVMLSIVFSLQACAVVAVADAAVTVVATGVKVTAKAVGALADAVIPDSNDDN